MKSNHKKSLAPMKATAASDPDLPSERDRARPRVDGVGASAGGLEAFTWLLKRLPTTTSTRRHLPVTAVRNLRFKLIRYPKFSGEGHSRFDTPKRGNGMCASFLVPHHKILLYDAKTRTQVSDNFSRWGAQ
jgi:hypothetical protein